MDERGTCATAMHLAGILVTDPVIEDVAVKSKFTPSLWNMERAHQQNCANCAVAAFTSAP